MCVDTSAAVVKMLRCSFFFFALCVLCAEVIGILV